MYARLRAMLDHDPELWKPQPGDSLVGQVTARSVYHHDKWGDSPMVKVLDEHGKMWRWYALATVAKNELGWVTGDDGDGYGPDAVRVGDWVGALYVGRGSTSDGTEYEQWRIVVIRSEDAPKFSPPSGGGSTSKVAEPLVGKADEFVAAAPACTGAATSGSGVEQHGNAAPSDGPPEEHRVRAVASPASGGPPTCDTCGQPVTKDVMKKDGLYAHKACGFRVPDNHPLKEARAKL